MSFASNLLFLHGYVATPSALAAVAPLAPTPPASEPEPVVETRAPVTREHEEPAVARTPWRPGPFVLIDALCGSAPPQHFRIA